MLSTLTLCSLSLIANAASQEAPAPTAGEVALRFGEHAVDRITYRDWLVAHRGEVLSRSFVESWLYERAARAQGLGDASAEALRRAQAEIDERVKMAHRGDRSRWVEELKRGDRSPEGRIAERTIELEKEVHLERLAAVDRVVPEAKIVRDWELAYGKDGRRFAVRLLFKRFIAPALPGKSREEQMAERERLRSELEAEVAALALRVAQGEDFATLVAAHSEDPATRGRGGRPEGGYLDTRGWQPERLEELAQLAPGEVSGPVFLKGGFWLVQLVRLDATPLESVREELRAALEARGPESDECFAVAQSLWEGLEWGLETALFARGTTASPLSPDEPVMTIDGTPISRAEYGDWLARFHGEQAARRFAEDWILSHLAEEQGLTFTPEQIRQRVEEDIELAVRMFFKGDRERWERERVSGHRTLENYKRAAEGDARLNLIAEALVRRDREIQPAAVRAAWERQYGPGGKSLELRVIRIDPVAPDPDPEASPEEMQRRSEAAIAAARSQAAQIVERIAEGEDFATLARRFSGDTETRDQGGRLPQGFNHRLLPVPIVEAIEALQIGETTGALELGFSNVIFELLGRLDVPFEEVEAELFQELSEARPSVVEVAGFRNLLTRDLTIEVLPILYAR